jgi:uncharacterized membrane protein YhaH (DUF805 family)
MNKKAFWLFFATWLLAMSVVGFGTGVVGERLGAPFYFGFFFGFTLTGMTAMFVLAARLSNIHNRPKP